MSFYNAVHQGPKPAYLPEGMRLNEITQPINPKLVIKVFKKAVPQSFLLSRADLQNFLIDYETRNLSGLPLRQEGVSQGALTSTALRGAIAWAYVYFSYRNAVDKKENPGFTKVIQSNHQELELFLEKLPNMSIVNKTSSSTQCDDYVFAQENWYKKLLQPLCTRHRSEEEPLLLTYYSITKTPEPGCIVAYYDTSQFQHFGRVIDIQNKLVLVESKFGRGGYVYRHPLDGVLPMYGNSFLFLKKKTGIAKEMHSLNCTKVASITICAILVFLLLNYPNPNK